MYLAQFNIARLKSGLGMIPMWRFAVGADAIQRAAASAPGHVWSRQEIEDGDLYSTRSVWESPEALERFVYSGVHQRYQRRGETWFERSTGPNLVLWWVTRDARPSLAEAWSRLVRLRARGRGPEAFDFATLKRDRAAAARR